MIANEQINPKSLIECWLSINTPVVNCFITKSWSFNLYTGSIQELGCGGTLQWSRRGSCVGHRRRRQTVHPPAGGGQMFLCSLWNLQWAAHLVPATLNPLVAETGYAVELCQFLQHLSTQKIWRHLCNLNHSVRSGCWWRGDAARSIFKTRLWFKVIARHWPEVSVRQRLAAAAERAHWPPGRIPGLVEPQLHLSLVQPGGRLLSLLRPAVWVWLLVSFSSCRLISPWFWSVCVIQCLCLSQKSRSRFWNDAPVLQDVLCCSELWGHRESDDAFVVNVCRDEVHGARPGQSPQQLLGHIVSSLEEENDVKYSGMLQCRKDLKLPNKKKSTFRKIISRFQCLSTSRYRSVLT